MGVLAHDSALDYASLRNDKSYTAKRTLRNTKNRKTVALFKPSCLKGGKTCRSTDVGERSEAVSEWLGGEWTLLVFVYVMLNKKQTWGGGFGPASPTGRPCAMQLATDSHVLEYTTDEQKKNTLTLWSEQARAQRCNDTLRYSHLQ